MAEYGIVMALEGVNGNCNVKGHEKSLLIEAISFGSMSTRTGTGIKDRRISVEQTSIALVVAFGPWIVELQQACYVGKRYSKAVLSQLAQQVDNKSLAEPTVIQKITLEKPVVESIAQHWTVEDGARVATVSLNFEKILYEIDKKTADYVNRNFTAGAV